jgi:predicted transcriptional regulator of viral defense system
MKVELLFEPELAVFTTREFAARSGISMSSASRQLTRTPMLVRVTRGVWANPRNEAFHPHLCVEKLLGNEQGYVSFLTALHLHGIVSQIPSRIHVATTGHARRVVTPVGSFELFHIDPKLMTDGVVWADTRVPYRLATAEKALLDTLYISTRKGGRFRSLPELDLSRARFGRRRFEALLGTIEDPRIAKAVRARFEALLLRPRTHAADEPG